MKKLREMTALAFGLTLVACQDLSVVNPNAPDKRAVVTNPQDVQTLIYSAYRLWWNYTQHTEPNRAYSTLGNETTTGLQGGAFDVLREPREELPNFVEYFGAALFRDPWDYRWQVISTAFDGLNALRGGTLKITEGTGATAVDVTNRAQAFAYFLAGLGYVYLGFHFDQAYVVPEDMVLPPNVDFREMDKVGLTLRPYSEVAAYGRELLTKALGILPAVQRPIPAAWTHGVDISPDDLARIIHSFIARSLVYTARTPEERASVDWNLVLSHLDQGIRTDFFATYETSTWTSLYKEYAEYPTAARVNNRLFGPADTAGAFQDWLAKPVGERQRFTVRTPDRRITGATATSNGSYFGYSSGAMTGASTYGEYINSFYRSIRFGGGVLYRNVPMVTMSVAEMDFIRAEAFYRLGRKTEAADIINKTRTKTQTIGTVSHPGLPAVTAAGVPVSTRCVPRKPVRAANGTVPCGDLWDALMYEKRIETYGIEGIIPFADARGWGQLVEGSPIHFPLPARELEVIGKPFYSFGGAGRAGSAPAPKLTPP